MYFFSCSTAVTLTMFRYKPLTIQVENTVRVINKWSTPLLLSDCSDFDHAHVRLQ
jgi:hypothetical protein